jgi:hypothetical protein
LSSDGDGEAEGGRSIEQERREMVSTKKEAALEWREQTLFSSRKVLIINSKNRKNKGIPGRRHGLLVQVVQKLKGCFLLVVLVHRPCPSLPFVV